MLISLSDFLRQALKSYISKNGDDGLTIFINDTNKFIQINNQVYAENNPLLVVEVIESTVIDWKAELESDLQEKYNIIRSAQDIENLKSEKYQKSNKGNGKSKNGIFYYVTKSLSSFKDGELEYLSQDSPDNISEKDVEFVSGPFLHILMWQELKEKYSQYENLSYRCIPRGRVIYNVKNNSYIILADRCIINKKYIVNKIVSEFNIPKNNYVVKSEPSHYSCFKCDLELKLEVLI